MKKFSTGICFCLIMLFMSACTSESPSDTPQLADGKYVYAMQFEGDAPGYDDGGSRATTKKWTSGAAVWHWLQIQSPLRAKTSVYTGQHTALPPDGSTRQDASYSDLHPFLLPKC